MWFSARLLFESELSDTTGDPSLQEENIKLVSAESEDEARKKAEAIGRNEEIAYSNADGETVTWHFLGVLEVQDLCESALYDGVEVYSRLFWRTTKENTCPEG